VKKLFVIYAIAPALLGIRTIRFDPAFNGKCLVLVGTTDKPGTILLTATAPGLTSATLQLSSARPAR
jgi:hypothetical protein